MKVSIILPTYNEADNIVELVHAIRQNLPEGWQQEIIVVDDNSPDGTYQRVVDAFRGDPAVIPVLRTTDRGLAKSIRAGIDAATGDYIVLMDTDFTHDPKTLRPMLHLLQVCNIVVGSRFCAGGSMEDVPHYACSLLYNWFLRLLLRTQIQDNLSGFLALDRKAIDALPKDRIFFGYGDYCFRLLHFAQRRGLSLLELPVQYQTRRKGKSKSNFGKLLISYTRAMLKLRMATLKERFSGRRNPSL